MNHSRYIRWQMPSFLLTAVGCLLITCATPMVAQQGTYHFPSYNSDVASVALAGSYSLKSQMPLYSLPTTSLHQMEKYYFTYSVLGLSFGDQKTSSALHSFALGYRLHKGLDLSIGTRLLRGEQIEVTNDLGGCCADFHISPLSDSRICKFHIRELRCFSYENKVAI